MTFAINKSEQARLAISREALRTRHGKLIDAIDHFNGLQQEAFEQVRSALADYHEAAGAAAFQIEDIHREHEEAYDSRSEAWQASQKGRAVQSWLEELSSVAGRLSDEQEVSEPTAIDTDSIEDLSDVLEEMYYAPEGE